MRAGIVTAEQVAAFRWSSLPRFIKGPRFRGLIAADWLAARGGWSDSAEGWRGYVPHLMALAANPERQKEDGFEDLSRGWAIGTAGWRRAVAKDHADLALHPGIQADEVRELKQARWARRLEQLLAEAGRTPAEAAAARKGADWKVALALSLRQQEGAAVKWITGHLSMGHPDYVRSLLSKAQRMAG